MPPSHDINRLLDIMAALRTPVTGCPWDIEQTYETIAPYTIEEAHEVADAIARNDLDDLKDELGDLLFQVVFHSRIAEEAGVFTFGDVAEAIAQKLVRRHPHVFGDTAGPATHEQIKGNWARIKAEEKAERAARKPHTNTRESALLSTVKAGLPALARALELQKKAATVGFDWKEPAPVIDKVREETDEVESALKSGDMAAVTEEVGDLMFTAINLARVSGVDPEAALRRTNAKFEQRFAFVERELRRQGKTLAQASLDEMEALWIRAKTEGAAA